MRPAECHPNRLHLALGLCGACYRRLRATPYRELSEDAKEKSRAANRKSYQKRKLKHSREMAEAERIRTLRRSHNMSVDEFNKLGDSQNWRCAVCRVPHGDDRATRLQVDHDHSCCPGTFSCGKCIRGLLCLPCNMALGALKDNPERILALLQYIRKGSPNVNDAAA